MKALVWLIGVGLVIAACESGGSRDTSPAPSATSLTSPTTEPATATATTPAPAPTACDPSIDDALRVWAAAGFSGSVAVWNDGGLDCAAGYGVADRDAGTSNGADTVFSIGSISKLFTAVAILQLTDESTLALDDRAGDWLPELTRPVADATIRQLLVHASGLAGFHGEERVPLEREAAIAAIDGLEVAFEPGTETLYSNSGYTLLALIVETAAGRPFREYMTSDVLTLPDGTVLGGFWDGEPAAPGPRAIGYLEGDEPGEPGTFQGPHWAIEGNGGLAMSAADLARWTAALFAGDILSRDAVQVLTTPIFENDDGTGEAPGWIAFDASVFGERGYATAGGGSSVGHDSALVWFPDSDRGFVAISNTQDLLGEQLMQAILPAFVAGDPLPTPEVPDRSDPSALAPLVGDYALADGGQLRVASEDGWLRISAAGASALAALFPAPDFVGPGDTEEHERLVDAFISGEVADGRELVETLEVDHGPLTGWRIDGTIFADIELRSYVTLIFENAELSAWLALDRDGQLAAGLIDVEPPSLTLGRQDGAFVPLDLDGTAPDIAVSFGEDGLLTIEGPDAATEARRGN